MRVAFGKIDRALMGKGMLVRGIGNSLKCFFPFLCQIFLFPKFFGKE
jgi:hypothetical protein